MKHKLILFFTLISIFSFSQNHNYSFSASISNNGQVSHIDEFNYGGISPAATANYTENKFKIDLYGERRLKGDLFFFAKGGFGKRVDKFDLDNQGSKGRASQSFTEIALGLNYQASIEKLTFSSGVSIPVFLISDYIREDEVLEPGNEYKSNFQIKGGHSFGINSVIAVRYYFTSNFYGITTFTVGYLNTKVGGWQKSGTDYEDPNVTDNLYDGRGTKYETWQLTRPDVSVGIGYKFAR